MAAEYEKLSAQDANSTKQGHCYSKFFDLEELKIKAGTRKGMKLAYALGRFHTMPMLPAIHMDRPDICARLVKRNADATIGHDEDSSTKYRSTFS